MSAATPGTAAPGTNVETASVQEPIQVVGGDAPVSFDALEAVSNWRSKQTEQKQEQKAPEKQAKPEKDEIKSAKAESKQSEDKEQDTRKAKAQDGKLDSKAEQKTLRLKNGEEQFEVAPSAMVEVKVNGKTIEVPVQEVINRYSQQKHLDDLYRNFKNERQAFDSERSKMNEILSKSKELLLDKKDLRSFLDVVAETMGTDGNKLYEETAEQMRAALELDLDLSPEERRIKQLESETTYYRTKAERERTAKAEAEQTKALESEVSGIISDLGIEKAEFVKAYDDLVANGADPNTVTPKMVAQFYSNARTIERIETRLKDINPELATSSNVEKLATLAIQTGANESEIEAVIQELYENETEKKLSKKINKTMKAKATPSPRRAGSDPLFFDDLAF
jgi:hypothetical protein